MKKTRPKSEKKSTISDSGIRLRNDLPIMIPKSSSRIITGVRIFGAKNGRRTIPEKTTTNVNTIESTSYVPKKFFLIRLIYQ